MSPVLQPGEGKSWEQKAVFAPAVVFEGGKYHMWYVGTENGDSFRIGYAVSDDGLRWTRYADNPVLPLGAEGSWDSLVTDWPTVVFDENDGVFRMWYDAYDTSGIGCATSRLPRFRRGDCNDDGAVNIADAVFSLAFLFLGGPPPPAPGPETCGDDLTEDGLGPCQAGC